MKVNLFNRLTGKIKPMPILAFDIETRMRPDIQGQFMLGGVYNGEDYRSFTDRQSMIKFMINPCFRSSIWFAHNLEYDLNRIFLDDARLERAYLGSRLLYARYPLSANHYIYFWDSYNLSYAPLKLIGEKLGMLKHSEYLSDTVTSKLIDANRQDCKILWTYIIKFQETINKLGANLRPSLASISLDLYRRRFLKDDWIYEKIDKPLLDTFRKAYYGGRTEIFNFNPAGVGAGNYAYYYDLVSSYPAAMLNKYPLLDSIKNRPDLDAEGITQVKIKLPETYYPPLPYRDTEKLLFPCGNWTGWYCNNELRHAVKLYPDLKIKVLKGYHFTETDYIFTDYVKTIYQKRKEANNEIDDFVYKIMLNALYGKFALKNSLEIWTGKKRDIIRTIPVSCNVIWSAYTTAYARNNLLDLLLKSKSIYCDTDSSISSYLIKTSHELGGIGLKAKLKNFRAIMPKHYEFTTGHKYHYKIKGVPSGVVKAKDGSYNYSVPLKFKSALVRKMPLWAWVKVKKFFHENYDKRIKLDTGDTKPIIVNYG